MADLVVAACLQLADLRPEVDPTSGAVHEPVRSPGPSTADEAALEHALRLGEAWGAPVLAVTAGPPPADALLRHALAAGAERATRVELEAGAPSDVTAAALAEVLGDASVVCCGDAGLDRGTGAVPALLAAHLGAAQALGLVSLTAGEEAGRLAACRRLDRGRRERLLLAAPAVVSVEAASARVRRAPLPAVLAAGEARVELHRPRPLPTPRALVVGRGPYRPRPRVRPGPDPAAPARERALALLASGARADEAQHRLLRATPEEAADVILDQLARWGHRPVSAAGEPAGAGRGLGDGS